MHLIPQSWSHLHILLSVFPSVGLVFALGFYAAAMVTKNEGMQRSCLLTFGMLALLGIPIFLSGDGSSDALSGNPKVSQDMLDGHYGWAVAALGVLAATGIVAWIELWRTWRGRPSDNALHLVLGLALVTLLLMVIVGAYGWEINHPELQLATKKTPQVWSHIHIVLNHFPTIGFVFALGFYVTGLATNNAVMKRTSLVAFVICAILGIPTFISGNAAMWALTDPPVPGISKAAINAHRDWALYTLFGLAFTGVTAWIELWRFRQLGRFSNRSLYLVLVFAVVTLGVMAEAGHRGGQINHPEIRTEAMPTDPTAYLSPAIETHINDVFWFVPWQTVHFFGFSLVFGTALAVSLRVLGVWKSLSFSAVHRILPLGVFGVVTNVFSGMLILQADSSRYLNNTTFAPKIAFLTIGAIAVLYFSLAERLWTVKAGEEAPMSAKWVAALVLLSWIGVIMGGRLLAYL
jgi:uncharacterized membrane protein